MITEHRFTDATAAAVDLAGRIAALLNTAVAARGIASLALSGGRSPRAMLETLGAMPVDWSRIIMTLVDERWVDPSDPASNERLVRDTLLNGPASTARFIGMKNDAASAHAGQPACERAFATLPWPIDIIVLGMGEDGHTASLFPGAKELAHGLSGHARTVAVTPPDAPHGRLSMTAAAILSSRQIMVQISGGTKAAVYRRALSDGPVEELPIRLALRQDSVPVDIWITA
ncbi:MAG: 6-phosphogluconolactonase [Sphingobium sp.]